MKKDRVVALLVRDFIKAHPYSTRRERVELFTRLYRLSLKDLNLMVQQTKRPEYTRLQVVQSEF